MAALRAPITSDDHVLGDPDAAVALVEYGDYQCPHCALAHPIVHRVLRQFGGALRYVYRHFPISEIHPLAGSAAEAAEFAGAHGLFWEMHDAIFSSQPRLSLPLLFNLAQLQGLSAPALHEALTSGIYAPKVRRDFMGGVRSGVNGTPTFFVNGQRHDAPYDFEYLASAIQAQLQHARTLP